jgi:hypothetical protein
VPELVSFIESAEPQLLAFNEYLNAERNEVTVVQVHPDARSMERHLELVAARAAEAYAETVDATVGIQVFGVPSGLVLDVLRRQAGAGVPQVTFEEHLGGFTRLCS